MWLWNLSVEIVNWVACIEGGNKRGMNVGKGYMVAKVISDFFVVKNHVNA